MSSAVRFHVYRSGVVRKEWRWRMQAGNNRIIATSGEGYRNKQDCLDAIDMIQQHADVAEVRG